MGNMCAQDLCGQETAEESMESTGVRVDSPKTIIRRVEVESIVKERELTKIYWTTREVIRWLGLMEWGRYKALFLEKNIDGESLADIRPLTLVREFAVEPIDAFPLFNDISPLFRTGEFRVKDFDLEFRRVVDLSTMEKELDERISLEVALGMLGKFRAQDVETGDPALEFFVGVLSWEFLQFLRRPPTKREQAIIRGEDTRHLSLPQKITHLEVTLDDDKEDLGSVEWRNVKGKSALEKSLDIRLASEKVATPCTTQERPPDNLPQLASDVKEPLSLDEPDHDKTSKDTSGYLHEECPICLTPFDEGRDVMALPCAHLFCQRCITDWLSLERSCPICQMNPDDEDLTMALLDSAYMACSLPNFESSENNLLNDELSLGRTVMDEDQKSPLSLSRGLSGRRSSYYGPSPNHAPCSLCQGPVNVSKKHVWHNCGHVFHKRCSKATGHRGGCPFCTVPQARVNKRKDKRASANRNQPRSANREATVWQVRKHSRWVDLPPNVGRCLDLQMSQRRPTTEVVVFDEKRYEIRAKDRQLVDLSHKPPRTYRIRKLRSQAGYRSEPSCSVM